MNRDDNSKALGIASFALSLSGLASLTAVVFVQVSALWLSALCVALSAAALVLGIVSRKKQRQIHPLAIAGIIISIITLIWYAIIWSLIVTLFFFFSDVIHSFSGLGRMG